MMLTITAPLCHENPRCVIFNEWPQQRTEMNDLGSKLAALILLSDRAGKYIIVPSREEWIGLNLLERDDEILRTKQGLACDSNSSTSSLL